MALEKLYLDNELREKMGTAGRKRTEEFYLWDRLGDHLQQIYQEVLPEELTGRGQNKTLSNSGVH